MGLVGTGGWERLSQPLPDVFGTFVGVDLSVGRDTSMLLWLSFGDAVEAALMLLDLTFAILSLNLFVVGWGSREYGIWRAKKTTVLCGVNFFCLLAEGGGRCLQV